MQPLKGFSKFLDRLREQVNDVRKADGRKPMAQRVLHDLRGTARTLMSPARAGVDKDTAERVLGHVLGQIREKYDQHDCFEEKRHPLHRLAAIVTGIVTPPPAKGAKVVKFTRKKAA